MSGRVEAILGQLDERDVLNGEYPTDATTPTKRRRWNQSRLLALAFYHTYVPTMLPGEYSQEVYGLAASIYGQDDKTVRTGSEQVLVEDITEALARGLL